MYKEGDIVERTRYSIGMRGKLLHYRGNDSWEVEFTYVPKEVRRKYGYKVGEQQQWCPVYFKLYKKPTPDWEL